MEYVTLGIAIWGAIVATILAIREMTKDKRKLKIILEQLQFQSVYQIIITNTGFRPITIQDIQVFAATTYGDRTRDTPWDEEYNYPKFPFKLEDSESVTFRLTTYMNSYIRDNKYHLNIVVYDGEGRTYTKYAKGEYNEKWGYHQLKSNMPSFIMSTQFVIRRFFSRFRQK